MLPFRSLLKTELKRSFLPNFRPSFARLLSNSSINKTKANELHSNLPSSADIVIIGGGVIGCSTLYHLQTLGVNAILLEKDQITAGTTWHSAGLVWRLRPSEADILLINRTRELAKNHGILEQETGQTCGWNASGGLFIANNKERLDEYKRLQTIGKYFNIESKVLTPAETQDLYPLMNISDVYGTLYSPGDGTVEPAEYASTLARAAKKRGGQIYENTTVNDFVLDGNGKQSICGVITDTGEMIKTKRVVLCGGVWSRDLAAKINVDVPLCAMRHAYVLTDVIPGIRHMPCVRDHDLSLYLRVQGECLQVGGYEPNPIFWDRVEPNFAFSLFNLDWDVFQIHLENGSHRVPIIGETGIKSEVCGPESFTADHKPLLGPVPNVNGFYLGCGFNSSGIMLSGGCGQQLAHWVVNGHPQFDIFSYDIQRFHSSLTDNTSWIQQRSHESYAKNYSIVFPMDEPLAGRGMRKSHLHNLLLKQGCIFQERHGYERPAWFSNSENVETEAALLPYDFYGEYGHTKHENYEYRNKLDGEYTFDFAENHSMIGEEVKACRERVAIFDQSYFGKFFLKGTQATDAIQYLCTNMMNKAVGCTVYTSMCNISGTVECDLAVSRIADDEYYITAGGLSCSHDWNHIQSIIDDKQFDCQLSDKSDEYAMISVMGRNSIHLLQKLTDAKLENEYFPFATHQEILVLGTDGETQHKVRAIRLTFVGELGWELHVPKESCVDVYQSLFNAGYEFDVRPAGYRAIDSLSCEKGYLHWHEDIGLSDTPFEAGIGFVVNHKLKKTEIDFHGREALMKQIRDGLHKKLVFIRVSSMVNLRLHGLETIWIKNSEKCIGFLRRVSYDYSKECSIGTAYIQHHLSLFDANSSIVIDNKYIESNEYEIEIMGERYPCEISLKALFDPKNERVKGNYLEMKTNEV